MPQIKFHLFALLLSGLLSSIAIAQAPPAPEVKEVDGSAPTYKLNANAHLLSNYIYHGLTQTNSLPAIQSEFWFNFGSQLRAGMFGSNVSYPGIDTHVLIRLAAEAKVSFSPNAKVVLRFSDNEYFANNDRSGNTLNVIFDLFGYRVLIDSESNWDGARVQGNYFGFQKVTDFSGWQWDNQVGYSMLRSSTYSNYFDFRSFFGSVYYAYIYKFGLCYSNAQFDGRGGTFFVFDVGVNF